MKSFVICFVLAVLSLSIIVDHNRAAANNFQDVPRPIEGKHNPEAIPDHIAHDAFLRSLVAHPGDGEGERRAETFAEDALGFPKAGERSENDKAAVKTLLAAAARYAGLVSVMDAEVKALKDQHSPQPSREVMTKLAHLQRQKASLAAETLSTLDKTLLITKDHKAKVLRHIANDIKRGITFVVPEKFVEPSQCVHHDANQPGMGTHKTAVSPVAQWLAPPSYAGESYTYTRSSYSFSHMEVYGYGLTAENYSSRGHTYQMTVETRFGDGYTVRRTDPDGCCSSPPISITNVIPMLRDGVYYDGLIETETTWTGYCPTPCGSPAG